MAMSLEKMNEKLEKVLRELDAAIENIDKDKVEKQMIEIGKLNTKTEGQANDALLAEIEQRMQAITDEINNLDNGLETHEINELANIRDKVLETARDPFQKVKDVVDSLSQQGINQEDLKNYKRTQINDNLAQIVGLKENNQQLAIRISNIEMRYIEKIENNEAAMEIIKEIGEKKNSLVILNPNKDESRINIIKSEIRNKISELSSKGVDVSSIQDFESNPSVIDSFQKTKLTELRNASDDLAARIPQDQSIPEDFKAEYELNNVTNAKELKEKYKEMVGARQKNASKITTLEAENKQIDKTIQTLEKEEQIEDINILYNEDGTEKDETTVGLEVLSNNKGIRQNIEEQMEEKFGGKFGRRFVARMNYFRETQNVGGFKAFWKALKTTTSKIKKIEAVSEAAKIGRNMSDKAVGNMTKMAKRQNDFKETIRREAAKQMIENMNLEENDIRDDVISKAYESASKDDEVR